MGWKNLFKRIEMPDKNDPKYRETYEQQVAAGEKFAEVVGIKCAAGGVELIRRALQKIGRNFIKGPVRRLFSK